MDQFFISVEEVRAIKGLLSDVSRQYKSVEDPGFLNEVTVIAHELPRSIRNFLNNFKLQEPAGGACLIKGYPVDDKKIGPTPEHWKQKSEVSPTLEQEILMMLLGSLLGDAIAWATQQDAHIIHDVLPIKADENEQISTGSNQVISWHNEDAFHPFRGDYVALMCLRNSDRIPTTLASADQIKLSHRDINILFEPRFVIYPDDSHAEKNNSVTVSYAGNGNGNGNGHCNGNGNGTDPLKAARERIRAMHSSPSKTAVLYGDPHSPYLRLDPYFMRPSEDNEAQYALNTLIRAVDKCLGEVVLEPGDFLFVDNYRAVHGRKPFKARYDGTDRWLKRMNITSDLRKSRSARTTSSSRVIY
ncbi:MAG TPA: guanitoxin biosynthesis L-enduracididine beta-hydroxylase GntD [Pyrinomonadaceae bacterium]|nr:guanitoxin biosynthesis L-enduracididine beta-hydroxylase GntD [Pyrinomonadaceae bacterium]